jgi:hypothetical protein
MSNQLVKQGDNLQVGAAKNLAGKLRRQQRRTLQRVAAIDRVLLADGSGSMTSMDAVALDGSLCSRWEAEKQAIEKLVPVGKGRLAVYVFSDTCTPVKGSATGNIGDLDAYFACGGTAYLTAFETVKIFHSGPELRALLVSDGAPTDAGHGLEVMKMTTGDAAMQLGCPVDTVYVGPCGGEAMIGRAILQHIANVTGGMFQDMAGSFNAAKFIEHSKRVLQLEA